MKILPREQEKKTGRGRFMQTRRLTEGVTENEPPTEGNYKKCRDRQLSIDEMTFKGGRKAGLGVGRQESRGTLEKKKRPGDSPLPRERR